METRQSRGSVDERGARVAFVVGCPRSGTTWLRELLDAHPKVYSSEETHLFDKKIGPELRKWRLGKNQDTGAFLDSLRKYAIESLGLSALGDGVLRLEKTPDHALFIPEILEIFPECRIIHMIRDPRDVVASLLAASKSWAHWAPKTARAAARYWVESVKAVRLSTKGLANNQFYELRYENLLRDPQATLRDVSRFLGLQWNEVDLLAAIEKNNAATIISKRGGSNPSKFLRKAQIGSWKTDLSFFEKIQVWSIARRTMKDFGYHW